MTSEHPPHPANLLGIDFRRAAIDMGPPPVPIVDVHLHVGGTRAAELYREIATAWGIRHCLSMTQLEQVESVSEALGDMVQFIAIPSFSNPDRRIAHGPDFMDRIRSFRALGAKIVKFWCAPRGIEYGEEVGDPGLLRLGSPVRRDAMDLAASLDMMFMVHIADPDTWFATRYNDADRFGTKASQYEPLEELLDLYPVPWIAAHLGGWPEDLDFLDGMLSRHPNLHLDTSATKWMVRELSRHDSIRFTEFLTRWSGRILFGSDILTSDDHLEAAPDGNEMTAKASSLEEAYDLYASRYWALRTLFESDYDGPSPIADPDLHMVDPETYGPLDSPTLRGHRLSDELLRTIYFEAARNLGLLEPDHSASPA